MGLQRKSAAKKPVAAKSRTQKAFKEAATDAAKTAVETVQLRDKAPRRGVTFVDTEPAKNKSAAAAAKRAIVGGIVAAKKRQRAEEDPTAAYNKEEEEENAEDSDAESNDSVSNSDEENLSELADSDNSSEASDEKDWENPFEKSKREGTRLTYEALRLRFLPQEFQEPQLFKFLSQFGANVLNCFCVRSRRTHQSKGIAYVQFDNPSVLPIVVEECHGMSLGGRALQAHTVTLHRAMPSKEKVLRRRRLAYAYKTKGAPLQTHDLRKKNPIAALVKYTRVEKANNEHLKRLGIDYAFHGFEEQLGKVPRALIIRKKQKAAKKKQQQNAKVPSNDNKDDKDNKHNVESTVVSSLLSAAAAATKTTEEKKTKKSVSGKDTAVASPASARATAKMKQTAKKSTAPAKKRWR